MEVTCRTIQGRFLLKPSPLANDIIRGVLGRAQRKYPVEIHAFAFMSNHYHLLISVADSEQMAKFMNHLNGNLARELGRLHNWTDKFWSRRYQAIVISEEQAAQEERMKYILSQGVKERLVAHPVDWPGVQSVETLLRRKSTVEGHWRDRTREFHARGLDSGLVFRTRERVFLTPLPCWADRNPKWIAQRIQELIQIVQQDNPFIERSEIPDLDPTYRPSKLKRRPAPMFHCASKAMRRILYEAYSWFVLAYREACARLKAGNLTAAFPPGSFPPPRPFVPV